MHHANASWSNSTICSTTEYFASDIAPLQLHRRTPWSYTVLLLLLLLLLLLDPRSGEKDQLINK